MRRILPLAFIFLLAACGSQTGTPTPPEEPPTSSPPEIPNDPNAIPFAGEWRVSFVSSASGKVSTYALNITRKATSGGVTRGAGLAIVCQSSTVCDYVSGATTTGFGSIGDFKYSSGRVALSVSILDDELFFTGDDTDNAAATDSQGRQVVEGSGEMLDSSDAFIEGYISATRMGEARTLQPAPVEPPTTPTPPTEPTPPNDPTPPTPPTDPGPISKPPVINSFTASSRSIETGDSVTLSWNVDDADALSISPGVGAVTGSDVTVKPDKTTAYTLTATNTDGSDDASVKITVQDPKPPEPEEAALRYWVDSDCGRVSTTYATAGGGTAQRDSGNGYVYTVESGVRSGTFLYISAQNQCDRGNVTVRIYKRGNIYKETSSSGAYVIATASGTY